MESKRSFRESWPILKMIEKLEQETPLVKKPPRTKPRIRPQEKNETFEEFLYRELFMAYLEARKGKRGTTDEHIFELNSFENIYNLKQSIIERNYQPGDGIAFITFRPVIREIFAAPFRDRVVHHFLYNVSYEWWDRRMIEDSYSCREGKGTMFGARRAAMHMRSVSDNYTKKAYVIKLDIQGHFMSLQRELIFERVVWGLDRQFPNRGRLYETCKYLWERVVFDDPTLGVHLRNWPKNWRTLPQSKSLFGQPVGQGIVIGNLTSQLISNIFMDKLDRFVRFELGYKHYGRYVDDFYIMVPEEEYEKAKKDVAVIEAFLKAEMGLTLHPKKRYFQDITKGFDFVGARIYPHCVLPGKRMQKNFYKALEAYRDGDDKAEQTVVALLGMMQHYDSRKFVRKALNKVFG